MLDENTRNILLSKKPFTDNTRKNALVQNNYFKVVNTFTCAAARHYITYDGCLTLLTPLTSKCWQLH